MHFSKNSLKWDGNKMKSETREGVLTLVKLETDSMQYKNQAISCFIPVGITSTEWFILGIAKSNFFR